MILTKKTQKGFSLLELLLVVAVGAILILAGLAIYRNISQNTQINEATRLVNVIKQETQRIFQGEPDYTGLTNTILTNADAVPPRYTSGAGVITSPFDTAVTLAPTAAPSLEFTLTMAAVPTAACIKLGLEFTDDDPDFQSLSIGGANVATTVAAVDGACAGAATVDMIWTFE